MLNLHKLESHLVTQIQLNIVSPCQLLRLRATDLKAHHAEEDLPKIGIARRCRTETDRTRQHGKLFGASHSDQLSVYLDAERADLHDA
jgi:hypothetical protein